MVGAAVGVRVGVGVCEAVGVGLGPGVGEEEDVVYSITSLGRLDAKLGEVLRKDPRRAKAILLSSQQRTQQLTRFHYHYPLLESADIYLDHHR